MDQRYPSTWMLCSQLFMVRFWWALLSKWSCGRYEKLKSIRNIYVNSCEQIEGIVDHVRNLPLSWCADRFIQRAVEYLYLIHWWWKTIDLFQNPEGIFLPHRWWYHKQAKAMVMALASFLVLYATNSPAPTMTFDVMPTRSREFRGSAPEFYIYIYIWQRQTEKMHCNFVQTNIWLHSSSNISMQHKYVWMEIQPKCLWIDPPCKLLGEFLDGFSISIFII